MASPALNISQQRQDAFLGLWWWKAVLGALQRGHGWNSTVRCQQRQLIYTQGGSCSDFTLLHTTFATLATPLWDSLSLLTVPWPTAYCHIPAYPCCASCHHGAGPSAIPWGPACPFASCFSSWNVQRNIHRQREKWSVLLTLTGSHGLRTGGKRPSWTSNSWKGPLCSLVLSSLHSSGKYRSYFRSQTL